MQTEDFEKEVINESVSGLESCKLGEQVGMNTSEQRKSILELSHTEVREFLLKAESYCSVDLPPYFVFNNLIAKVQEASGSYMVRPVLQDKIINDKERLLPYIRPFTRSSTPLALMEFAHIRLIKSPASHEP